MTIEEAIKIIDSAMTTYGEDAIDYDEVFEAKDMAIRSLEAWEKVKEEIEELFCEEHNIDWSINLEMARIAINDLPSCIPQKKKTGKWIDEADKIDTQFGRHTYKCSKCGKHAEYFVSGTGVWWDRIKPNFCPNCGSKISELQESEK